MISCGFRRRLGRSRTHPHRPHHPLSLLVLPLYIPTLIFGAQTVTRAATGQDPLAAWALMTGLSLFAVVAMPFAAALALRVNLR